MEAGVAQLKSSAVGAQEGARLNALWISWEKHTRSRSVCREMQIELFEILSRAPRPFRYIRLIYRTFLILSKSGKSTVIVQNPSLVLALFANIYCLLAGRVCIVDCHNAGLFPLEGRSKFLSWLANVSIRLSSFTIVTNRSLGAHVEGVGGKAVILPDPLPVLGVAGERGLSDKPLVVFICTWASDEPYEEVLKAAALVGDNVQVAITGNHAKVTMAKSLSKIPKNVRLTGYLSDEEFHDLLVSSWLIMDLTTREDCLVCGAYEATSLEKPLILSDTLALREYFGAGAIYTPNDSQGIAKAITEGLRDIAALRMRMKTMRQSLAASWLVRRNDFLGVLRSASKYE